MNRGNTLPFHKNKNLSEITKRPRGLVFSMQQHQVHSNYGPGPTMGMGEQGEKVI